MAHVEMVTCRTVRGRVPVIDAWTLQRMWDDFRLGDFRCARGHLHVALGIAELDLPGMPNAYRLTCMQCGTSTPMFVVRDDFVQIAAP
jgi:hypothetical protein